MPNPHNLDVSKIEFVSLVTKFQPLLFKELSDVKGKKTLCTRQAGRPGGREVPSGWRVGEFWRIKRFKFFFETKI